MSNQQPQSQAEQNRVDEIVESLVGTCATLDAFLTDDERSDRKLMEAIDLEAFECNVCGWWCRVGEEESESNPGVCDECDQDKDT